MREATGEAEAGGVHVIVIHGLWMRAFAMRPLCGRLGEAGYRSERLDYASVWHGPERCIDAVAERLSASSPGAVHLVGHSLGGLIALHACARAASRGVRVVCLGSPLTGSDVARALGRQALTRWALGRSHELLCAGTQALEVQAEVGMIAGTRKKGLGHLVAALESPHDGTVSLSETRWPALVDHVCVDASHSGLLFSRDAAAQAVEFLRYGRFARNPRTEG